MLFRILYNILQAYAEHIIGHYQNSFRTDNSIIDQEFINPANHEGDVEIQH